MTYTGTQNRPYTEKPFTVRAVFTLKDGTKETLVFNWNDRTMVRNFAAQSDRILRGGGKTLLESVVMEDLTPVLLVERQCITCKHAGMDMDMNPYCAHPTVLKRMPHGQALYRGVPECPVHTHPLWEARPARERNCRYCSHQGLQNHL